MCVRKIWLVQKAFLIMAILLKWEFYLIDI